VSPAINFDSNLWMVANEVDDVAVDRNLSAKVKAFVPQATKMPPELSLLAGCSLAKLAGVLIGHERDDRRLTPPGAHARADLPVKGR
jgi:hypothetical protein